MHCIDGLHISYLYRAYFDYYYSLCNTVTMYKAPNFYNRDIFGTNIKTRAQT